MGIPGVFGPTQDSGLPLNETTLADELRAAGYATAAVGKWHLGQRAAYLPAARGFDRYLASLARTAISARLRPSPLLSLLSVHLHLPSSPVTSPRLR